MHACFHIGIWLEVLSQSADLTPTRATRLAMRPFSSKNKGVKREPPESPPSTQEIAAIPRTWEEELQFQEKQKQAMTDAKKRSLPLGERTPSSAKPKSSTSNSPIDCGKARRVGNEASVKVKKETLPSNVANEIPGSKCPSRRVASGDGEDQHARRGGWPMAMAGGGWATARHWQNHHATYGKSTKAFG